MEKIKLFLKNLFSDKTKLWKILTFLSMALFLFLVFLIVLFFLGRKVETSSAEGPAAVKKNFTKCFRRDIDGVCVLEDAVHPVLTAVMIDNHPDARPVLGLEKASLIYEAEVEGGYTRYMAIFASGADVEQIGAVRSARPYFVYWAKEVGAVYAHCGGSPEALAILADEDIVDMNEYYNGQYFWRDMTREAPHNIMISGENLKKFIEKEELPTLDWAPWIFKNDSLLKKRGEDGGEIKINFSSAYFAVIWRYDRENNDYVRLSSSGQPQLTGDSAELKAKNIIIQTIPAEVIDEKLRLGMDTVGEGKATVCLDGRCNIGKWKKPDLSSRMKFYNSDDKEFSFNAGPTWIEVVRTEISLEY